MNDLNDRAVTEVAAATLASIGTQVSLTADAAVGLGRAVAKLADQRVRERPWQVALAAASLGVLAGLLMRRRKQARIQSSGSHLSRRARAATIEPSVM
jgi:ElaB/YqjD/DUF883 family membrane-anchored ribosome-binding protein